MPSMVRFKHRPFRGAAIPWLRPAAAGVSPQICHPCFVRCFRLGPLVGRAFAARAASYFFIWYFIWNCTGRLRKSRLVHRPSCGNQCGRRGVHSPSRNDFNRPLSDCRGCRSNHPVEAPALEPSAAYAAFSSRMTTTANNSCDRMWLCRALPASQARTRCRVHVAADVFLI